MSPSLEHLKWRYATKRYDSSKKLSDEQRNQMIEALRLSPSSFGLQPWKFVHVADVALREKLKAAAWGQPQLTEASDVFVLCSLAKIDEAYIDRFLADIASTRNMPIEALKDLREMLLGSVGRRTEAGVAEWAARQVYIALGVALTIAAENHIDASPMEGFDNKQFDEILGLDQLGLHSQVILALGFRSAEDGTQGFAKVRFPLQDVVIER